ncbi:DUF4157 domain-containing protein [Kribbella sp. NPDC058693]|uniref:eCIS core domain-containing protein n=1 Tax=Kribbella sp. NPDC058693 TaxID=3346602 RepID=UPI00365DB3CE
MPTPVLQRCGTHPCSPSGCDEAYERGVAPPVVDRVVHSESRSLDLSARTRMEALFGHDFADVRLHTGVEAAGSAHAVGAAAYTVGNHIVLGAGYEPGSRAGEQTLAHELVHVIQQRHATGPSVAGETPVLDMADPLEREAHELADSLTFGRDSDVTGRAGHQAVHRQPASPRPASSGVPAMLAPTELPRPPALPVDGAFQLVPVEGGPQALLDAMPDGVLMQLVPGQGLQPVAEVRAEWPKALEVAGTGSAGALTGANSVLMSQGFAAAGPNSIGVIALPQIRTPAVIDLARPLDRLGHTAVYVRQNGRIVWARGFGPKMTASFMLRPDAASEGLAAVPGLVDNDISMFKSTSARTIEYPIDPRSAAQILAEHPTGPGGTGGSPTSWTGRPNIFASKGQPASMCTNQNCVMYAIETVEGHLGGPVGELGTGSIIDIPTSKTPPGLARGTASQGKLYQLMGEAESGATHLSRPPGAIGPAVAGRMPTALRYIKWGGRVFVVIGIVAGGYEVWAAPKGQKVRTAIGVAGGFGGGLAGGALAGAAAGLVCGPGAPVCSLVLGIGGGLVGGVIGALAGRALFEGLFDDLTASTSSSGPPCPSCHAQMRSYERARSTRLQTMTLLTTELASTAGGTVGGHPTTLTDSEMRSLEQFLKVGAEH